MRVATIRGWVITTVVLASGASRADADVVFSNFGPGLGFNAGLFNYYSVHNPGDSTVAPPFLVETPFTIPGTGDFSLTSVLTPLAIDYGTGVLNVALSESVTSPSGQPTPGPGVGLSYAPFGETPGVVTLTPDDGFVVHRGETYFLIFELGSTSADSTPFAVSWYLPSTVTSSNATVTESGIDGANLSIVQADLPAIQIEGTPLAGSAVPEPSPLALIGAGCLGLTALFFRRGDARAFAGESDPA